MADSQASDIWIAGAAAAFTVDLLVYPLDTLKTRIQSPDYRTRFLHAASGAVNRPALFRGLYQGVGSVIVATLPSSGAFFTTYEGVKTLLEHTPLPTPLAHASASAVAELVSCAILTPAEVIKQNAQMASGPSPLARTLASFRSHPSALWTGYGALAARNLPFTALQFPVFERFRSALSERRRRETGREATLVEHGLVTAVAAGSAGALAAAVTTPVDVIKTRIMLAAGDGARRGSMAFARDIVREQGWRGLFRGGALRCVWTMLGSGLYLGVYESARMYLVQRREE